NKLIQDCLFAYVGGFIGLPNLSLESILAVLLAPIAWLMGVPWADCSAVGTLLGKKTILNEFIAYLDLQALIESNAISERAVIIATYALCGFANVGSIGIQIGGIGGIAPSRQSDLAKIGFRAMVAGTLACFTTACIAGMLL
ncbi:MAG: nucleoside transporter C-terminal domain-containing protein, partial [Cyanobacteria bacterium J06649_4]